MRRSRRTAWTALAVGAALIVTAGCSGSDSDSDSGAGSAAGASDAGIVTFGGQPENPLVPGNTNETGGGRVVDAIFTGLVEYNPDDASTEMAVATSIETTDNTTFTVSLNDGWTFHDGTPVTADSFIDAWNWVAYGPNGALNSYFMEPIAGFADLQSEDPDGDGPQEAPEPTATEMSGLKKVDDTTFEITLSSPSSAFQNALGYTAFSPLPESFFSADAAEWGKEPVGNGPFTFVSWQDNVEIKITRYDDYKGKTPQIKDVSFKLYQDLDAAYADLKSDNLDFLDQVPPSALPDELYKADLGERAINKPVLVVDTLSVPIYAGAPWDNADFRKALSMAIDRDTITQQIFDGARTPAKAYSSPVVEGYEETCIEECTYDPAKAKELLATSGVDQAITLSYNADGGHKEWAEAVCNGINQTLGLECTATPVATFAAFRQQVNAKQMTGLFRTGWQYDYPHIENGLTPLFATGASANDGGYSNPTFDAALKTAAEAPPEEAPGLYVEAEKLLVEDMPTIPTWSRAQQSGWSTKVDNVKITPFGTLDLYSITVN